VGTVGEEKQRRGCDRTDREALAGWPLVLRRKKEEIKTRTVFLLHISSRHNSRHRRSNTESEGFPERRNGNTTKKSKKRKEKAMLPCLPSIITTHHPKRPLSIKSTFEYYE